jgi:type VI protein secretion system component VasK
MSFSSSLVADMSVLFISSGAGIGAIELIGCVLAAVPGHSGSKGMTIMVSILVVVIICTLFYCVYCWRWRKRNGELQFGQQCSSARVYSLHLFLYSCTPLLSC